LTPLSIPSKGEFISWNASGLLPYGVNYRKI